jgi:hypothetical protein
MTHATRRRALAILAPLTSTASLHAAPAPASIGQVALGAGFPCDGLGFTFTSSTFTNPPVVVVQASRDGRPLACSADTESSRGFVVRLWDVTTRTPLDDGGGIDMLCVAILTADGSGIAAATVDGADGQVIRFAHPFARSRAQTLAVSGETPSRRARAPAGLGLSSMGLRVTPWQRQTGPGSPRRRRRCG